MKFVTSLTFALAATLGAASAFAAEKAADTMTPQQQKMSTCSKDAHAKTLKGDAYKTYMSTCMKGTSADTAATSPAPATAATAEKPAAAKPAAEKSTSSPWVATPGNGNANPQQQKMRTCAADAKAKGLKGPDRRAYMSTCLKADSTAKPVPAKPAAAK